MSSQGGGGGGLNQTWALIKPFHIFMGRVLTRIIVVDDKVTPYGHMGNDPSINLLP